MHPLYCEKGDDSWKTVTMDDATMFYPADVELVFHVEGKVDAPLCDCGHDEDGHEVGHTDHAGDTKPATPEMSLGSCTFMEYAFPTVICAVAQEDCNADTGDNGGTWHAPGHVNEKGCCHCVAHCDRAEETGEACTYYDPPSKGGDSDGGDKEDEDHMDHGDKEDEHSGPGDKEDGHGGHGHGGHGMGDDCGATSDDSDPLGPCAQGDTYPLFCSAAAADAASSVNAHHMMQGLFMPNAVEPMCHGNYVGDAVACACPAGNDDPGNDDPSKEGGDESDAAASRGLVAAAAALFLAMLA